MNILTTHNFTLSCFHHLRFTVFRSAELPMAIIKTVDAASVYRQYLGSPILGIPHGGEERLKSWPPLKPVNLKIESLNREESCVDVVLSSAGESLFSHCKSWTIKDDDLIRYESFLFSKTVLPSSLLAWSNSFVCWKFAHIQFVPKKGDCSNPSNYRPSIA